EKSDLSVPYFKLECCAEELEGNYCPALAKNAVDQPNGCPVDIWLERHDNGKRFSHDPTIAVTKDPLDPPTVYGT
ncbi:MAG TPA: hypothetical protein VLV54_03345, partial [Thermoanaerobaculia bacterium]|nr:hypothetical protein [Thermoanaerobaculia bacterium]